MSVVIPVAAHDESWRALLKDLKLKQSLFEVILSCADSIEVPKELDPENRVKVIAGSPGRAKQLNRGAKNASRKFLWFLHADTHLTEGALKALRTNIKLNFDDVRFFDLGFFDGPQWMWINALGVKLRSKWLKLPFGDQGFCLQKETFEKLGGYDENASYGEDHLLIWKAHELKISVRPMNGKLLTSARKYQKSGWLKTTREHVQLTYTQARKELLRIYSKNSGRMR